jgi:hypothetical protein
MGCRAAERLPSKGIRQADSPWTASCKTRSGAAGRLTTEAPSLARPGGMTVTIDDGNLVAQFRQRRRVRRRRALHALDDVVETSGRRRAGIGEFGCVMVRSLPPATDCEQPAEGITGRRGPRRRVASLSRRAPTAWPCRPLGEGGARSGAPAAACALRGLVSPAFHVLLQAPGRHPWRNVCPRR